MLVKETEIELSANDSTIIMSKCHHLRSSFIAYEEGFLFITLSKIITYILNYPKILQA